MQNGMIPAQPTPHHRPCFVPTSKNLIPPSKSGKTPSRLACRLVGRQVCRLGGRVGIGGCDLRPLQCPNHSSVSFCGRPLFCAAAPVESALVTVLGWAGLGHGLGVGLRLKASGGV